MENHENNLAAAGENNIEQMIKKFPPFFYRRHLDVIKTLKEKKDVYTYTLTEYGLAMAFELVKSENPQICGNMELIMDYDIADESLRAQINNPLIDAQRSIIQAKAQAIEAYKESENANRDTLSEMEASFQIEKDLLSSLENEEIMRRFPELNPVGADRKDALFSQATEEQIRSTVHGDCEQAKAYIIHRDGHTVTLFREKDTFMLCDSYNAYGAKDADHIPILRMIRDEAKKLGKDVKIYTENDKIQRDYDNCRIFSLETAVLTLNYLNQSGKSLADLIEQTKENVGLQFAAEGDNDNKSVAYKELNVEAIPTLLTIIPLIQSGSQIVKIAQRCNDRSWIEYIGEQLYKGNSQQERIKDGYSYNDLLSDLGYVNNGGEIKKNGKAKISQNNTISAEAARILKKLQTEYKRRNGEDGSSEESEDSRIDSKFQKASTDYIGVVNQIKEKK